MTGLIKQSNCPLQTVYLYSRFAQVPNTRLDHVQASLIAALALRICPTFTTNFSNFLLSLVCRAKPVLSSMKYCPHCHSELKDNATFCPHCGSDKNTGWKESAEYSDLDLPDYDEIVENEFGEKKKKSSPLTIVAVVIVVLAFMAAMVL